MKILTLICGCLIFSGISAQENSPKFKDEIKINTLYLILEFPEITFEHYLNEASSAGISVGFPITDFDIKGETTLFYRFYFSNRPTQGFLVEANAIGFIEEDYIWKPYPLHGEEANTFQFGLGIAIGYKFINSRGWVGEIYGGVGRVLTDSDAFYEVYPRGGISIGRAF